MAEPRSDEWIDLQSAADRLGVHYQTAYRWVRTGKLAAELVAGSYRLRSSDVDVAGAQQAAPSAHRPPSDERLQRQSDRLHDALVAGDETSARRIVTRLIDEGTPIVDVIQTVVVPPLRRIGTAWHEGRLSIWVEHRASAIVERLLGELAPNRRGRRRGRAVVAAVSGDQHSLPTTMAAVSLRDDNWHVDHLGADVPTTELIDYCASNDADVVVLSSTNPEVAPLAAATAAELRQRGVSTIVGSPGSTLDDLRTAARNVLRPGADTDLVVSAR
ncbi:MAG: B12-binding domain-containing protein [Actinomycetota bacterium]